MSGLNPEVEIERLVARAKLRKEEAKDCRDDGDIQGAVRVLQDAVRMIEESPLAAELHDQSAPSEPVKKLATQLADCLGMMGGNYRRLNLLAEAQDCFERGRVYEESPLLDVRSSYNMVNAITLPLEAGTRELAQQTSALRRAVDAISLQTHGGRRSDRWAWADLGECQLLLNMVAEAANSYRRARDLGDEDTVTSIVAVLQRLLAAPFAQQGEVAKRITDAIHTLSV